MKNKLTFFFSASGIGRLPDRICDRNGWLTPNPFANRLSDILLLAAILTLLSLGLFVYRFL